ncbi:MAG TPA: alcohol dehydrogenase catalytic domain-containing protein [Miltoncostaeaceae bacterium]|nr:alcohol dehydrogenase catalytic domain-containing protein [Miltoncostaeaceae bacterium]
MKAGVYLGPGRIRVAEVPDATLVEPTDALVRVTHAGICGSDLWVYRGELELYGPAPSRVGHEFLGLVEAVGAEVRGVRPGQPVIAPYTFSDGTCELCDAGLPTLCRAGGFFGGASDGGQGEAVRVPLADGTLVPLPGVDLSDDRLAASLATLTDVMGTGHHGALVSGVGPGGTAVVVGDGAVGLCAVLAARRLRAERVIVVGHHHHRLAVAQRFGATEVVRERGAAAVERVRELTGGGSAHVIECVGTAAAFATAIGCAAARGTVGHVGSPVEAIDLRDAHIRNVRLAGGRAPVRHYIPELLEDVLAGQLDPSPVMDLSVGLDDIPAGYAAMDGRRAIKVLVRVDAA